MPKKKEPPIDYNQGVVNKLREFVSALEIAITYSQSMIDTPDRRWTIQKQREHTDFWRGRKAGIEMVYNQLTRILMLKE